jgi:dephospho-CoA kinase
VVVGLTGRSGAGKSVAGTVFAEHGWYVIDCDAEARAATDWGDCLAAIRRLLGDDVFTNDVLDRALVAKAVFSDLKLKSEYEATVFPFILKRINELIRGHSGNGTLLNAPTLFESGANKLCEKIIAVTADDDTLTRRIISRDNLSRENALLRLSAQKSDEFFREHADIIIDNDGDEQAFLAKCSDIAKQLK